MPQKFILSLDQGTTSSRAIIFDAEGNALASAQKEFRQHYPKNGWVEHDALELWEKQFSVTEAVLTKQKLCADDIAGLGITNQRETTVLWDRRTGKPVHYAIVWQDRRTAQLCDQMRNDGLEETFRRKTGLRLDPYFSGTKLKWLLDNVPNARKRAQRGELAFGTIDTWLLWNLTGGEVHATDVTNASRTLLFNIKTGTWDSELLMHLDIPEAILPEVKPSSGTFGECSVEGLKGIPIGGIAGDQQSALFGQACFNKSMAKNTYGTGCFLLRPTSNDCLESKNNLLTTLACNTDGKLQYALEGSVFTGGAVIQWLRDELGFIKHAADSEALALSVEDSGGAILVPAFTGLGAPDWDPYARGTLCGMTRGTSAAHITRAALESIAFQSADLLEAVIADSEDSVKELRVDGGAANNNFLMQFQADIMQIPVVRPNVTETTALGAAYLAGLSTGYWQDTHTISSQWEVDKIFEPAIEKESSMALRAAWRNAVETAKGWARN